MINKNEEIRKNRDEEQNTSTNETMQKFQEDIFEKINSLKAEIESLKVNQHAADEMFKHAAESRPSSI
jgi:hypothetical protein